MAKSSNKNKPKAPEAQELPVSANSEPEIVVAVIEEVEAAAPDVALIGAEQPAKNGEEIQPSEDRKFPVTIRFDHGFWCPALQKSFMPGFYKAKDFKELKLLAPYGTVL